MCCVIGKLLIVSISDHAVSQHENVDVEEMVEDADGESPGKMLGVVVGTMIVGVQMVMEVGMHGVCVLYNQAYDSVGDLVKDESDTETGA